MIDALATGHQLLGYAVLVVVLTMAVVGFVQARDARPFTPGGYLIAAIAIDVQVLGGLMLYGIGQYWDHPSALVAYVHPLLAVLALVATHVTLKQARGLGTAEGHRRAALGLVAALVLVAAAIGAVSAGLRGAGV